MIADFRSDTVTKPGPGMLEAMQRAKIGDDVFREDPAVNELEEKMSKLFGMEAAMYCLSGTMSNQVGIASHTRPGDEVICERESHVYFYEGGGIARNSGCQVRTLAGDRGRTAHGINGHLSLRGQFASAHCPLVFCTFRSSRPNLNSRIPRS